MLITRHVPNYAWAQALPHSHFQRFEYFSGQGYRQVTNDGLGIGTAIVGGGLVVGCGLLFCIGMLIEPKLTIELAHVTGELAPEILNAIPFL
ncbi:hypothetical protein DdX_21995 [Ditylenchus destructor]|uniref:Uncharacterized protein n=1 Tax=Ditylenchus destructor TaxID=166010 RepID=A0AAD4QV67_9BILA|nr:hypothetical protein DdX_21995 [Ditylenchus destructor]